jgi:hypothetical protein
MASPFGIVFEHSEENRELLQKFFDRGLDPERFCGDPAFWRLKAAHRFFWAAAIRFRAAGLRTRFLPAGCSTSATLAVRPPAPR